MSDQQTLGNLSPSQISLDGEPRTPPSQGPPLQPVPVSDPDPEGPRFWLPTVIPGNRQKLTRLTRFGVPKLVGNTSPPFTRSAKRIQDLEALLAEKDALLAEKEEEK